MMLTVKTKASKFLACLLAVVVAFGVIPVGMVFTAAAATIDGYTITLTDGANVIDTLNDVEVTLTNDADNQLTATANTVNGVATFDGFVEEGESYTATIEAITGYDSTWSVQFTCDQQDDPDAVKNADIVLTALDKIVISGLVTDETDAPYANATVKISGYVEGETTTDKFGKYSFDAYKGQNYTITATATDNEDKYETATTTVINPTEDAYECTALKFAVKKFKVSTSAGANGTITVLEESVDYGDSEEITATANTGYRIDSFFVNGTEITEAKGAQTYSYELENIIEAQSVSVTFIRQTYKITFTVADNGKVTYNDGTEQTVAGGSVNVEKVFEESTDPANPTKVQVTATPNENYRVSKVVIDGNEPQNFNENDKDFSTELEMTADHTFTVEFALNEYNVTVTNGENGTATVNKSVVEYDGTATVTITPNEGYNIDAVLVNGTETNNITMNSDETSYNMVIANITEHTNIEITYSQIPVISMDNVTLNSSEAIKVFEDADSITYIYKNNGKAIFTTTKDGIRINKDKTTGKAYKTPTWTIEKSTVITKLEVCSNLNWSEIKLDKTIKIIIDQDVPEIESATTTPSGWTNVDGVEITVVAKDEGTTQNPSSGLSYVVWSKDSELDEAEVISSTNHATLNADGTYSFNSVEGEQNSTYYIYAVDVAGNISAPATVEVKIDKTLPTVDSVAKAPNTEYTNKDIVITVTASDTNATDANLASGINRVVYTTDGTLTESEILALGDSNKATYKDGGYSFTLKDEQQVTYYIYAIDNAGNVSVAETIEVKITRVKPSVDTVVKTPEYVWHNDAVTITGTVSSKADASPVVKVVYTTNNRDYNDATLNVNGEYEFTVSGEQNTIYSIYAIDDAGNWSDAKTIDVKIDTTKPIVNGFDFEIEHNDPASKVINWLTFGLFCNAKIKVTATVSDGTETDDSQCKEVVFRLYESDATNGEYTETEKIEVLDGKASTVIDINFKGTVKAIVYDNAGNDSVETLATTQNSKGDDISFIMTEDVESEITFGITTPVENDNGWYNRKDITLPINVNDNTNGDINSGLYSIKVDLYYNCEDTVSQTAEFNEWLGCDEDAESAILETEINLTLGTEETDIFKYLGDGQYKFVVTVVDNCGTVTSSEKVIYVDTTSAKITDISLGDKESEGVVQETDYGYYFKEDVDVIVTLDDKVEGVNDVSDVAQVLYYTVDYSDVNNPVTSDEIIAEYNAQEHKAIIPIEGEFKGQIYIWSVDNAGNNSRKSYGNDAGYDIAPVKPDGSILEPVGKHEVTSSIEIKATATTSTQNEAYAYTYGGLAQKDAIMSYDDAQLVPLYNSNPVFELIVKDEYSGIREIKVTVIENGVETVKTLSIANNGDKSGDDSDAWTITKEENSNLIISATRTIEVNGNYNNMVILVELTDRAGNSSYDYYAFGIDKTAPVIDVVYNEDSVADEENKTFYKADREATITITERNFRAEDVVFAITNTDKVIPEIDLTNADVWTEVKDDVNPDNTTYTAKIKYTADGDYTFDIAYKDNAENVANEVEQYAFTIDKTLPVITVAYDNNDAQNGNYYKADRIATLTIVEHNFDPARVNNIGFATDSATGEAVATTFPTISAWQNVGTDTYVATIEYTADSKYTFDIEFKDMAGNSIVDYTPVEFYVDKTAPTLEISGVADKSANKGTVAPIVTYSDTNFNVDAVTITLTGINNGKVNYKADYAPITNGQTYTYANFEEIQSVDDIYTLTAKLVDMAGNETEQTITFSANRFGSVYDLTEVEDVLGKYLTTEQDIVFTETNVDSLDRDGILIKLTKNGTPTDLIEGVDYSVETSGGNGRWSVYKYTIKKALFAGDGRYSVSVYSTDAAGNVNENIDETKAAEISFGIDKTTPVIVPIDFESNEQYDVEMKTVTVEIKDNLVLQDVKIYLNGQEIEYTVDGESYTFNIPESNGKQDVKIVVVDAAGNEQTIEVNDFTVSTNFFVRWYNDTPVFIGSIVGMVVLALGITIFFVFFKKKKKNEDEE